MSAPELFLLFKYTEKFEYPLAASLFALVAIFNVFVFQGFSSMPVCIISVIIIDIFLVIALVYLIIEKKW
jgi:hypothetical protein